MNSGIKLTEAEAAEVKEVKLLLQDIYHTIYTRRLTDSIGKQYVARLSMLQLVRIYNIMRGINHTKRVAEAVTGIIERFDFLPIETAAPEPCLFATVRGVAYEALRLLILHNAPIRMVEGLQFCMEVIGTYAVIRDYDLSVEKRHQIAKDITAAIRLEQQIQKAADGSPAPEGLKKPGNT